MDDACLYLRGRRLTSIFELLGSSEDNITYSVGWALAHSATLRSRLAQRIGADPGAFEEVRLQQFGDDKGYTDIELLGPTAHAIIEAKRGWWLPGDLQLRRYLPRFNRTQRQSRFLIAMSDCSSTYAKLHLQSSLNGIPLHYLGWRDVEALSAPCGNHAEKRLLAELRTYLRTVATMQNPKSNMVHVVALSPKKAFEGAPDSFIDVVEKRGLYFHPIGGSYPKEPPNYIAFRYGGRLQTIHHIEDFLVSKNLGKDVFGINCPDHDLSFFVYELGPAIRPPNEVRTGPGVLRSTKINVMLDLLLTSKTLTEAKELTRLRLADSTKPVTDERAQLKQ